MKEKREVTNSLYQEKDKQCYCGSYSMRKKISRYCHNLFADKFDNLNDVEQLFEKVIKFTQKGRKNWNIK